MDAVNRLATYPKDGAAISILPCYRRGGIVFGMPDPSFSKSIRMFS
jgi:hypothetical protein